MLQNGLLRLQEMSVGHGDEGVEAQEANGVRVGRIGSTSEPWVREETEPGLPSSRQDYGGRVNSKILAKVSVSDAPSYQLPEQQNRLALVLDPMSKQVPFTFGVEIFPAGHRTKPHVHTVAHEMFFIVSGGGEAFCNGNRFHVGPGDTVVFPPGCEHGIDAYEDAEPLYCLELMLPNQMFAEFVRAGKLMDGLHGDDMCVLAAIGCS
jgi:mannose-6-phosphate isomerase-like protein (cupin superfamily)